MSRFVFCMVCFSAYASSFWAEKRNSKIAIVTCIAILSIYSGLRAPTVGVDTPTYFYSIENDFPYAWVVADVGFRFVSRLLMAVFHDAGLVLLSFAIVINLLIILRLWDFRYHCSFSFMVLLYIMIHYIGTVTIFRQYIGIAIIFYSTRLIEKRKYITFLLLLVLATSIHMASMMGVGYLIFYIWKNSNNRSKKYLFVPALFALPLIGYMLVRYESSYILNYFSMPLFQINGPFVYRVLVFILAILLQIPSAPNMVLGKTRRRSSQMSLTDEYNSSVFFYLVGLTLSSLGMLFRTLNRLGFYYLPYELVFWGHSAKSGKSREICAAMIFVYAAYVFAANIITDGSRIFPFTLRLPG